MNGPTYVYETIIGASAERIWAALTTRKDLGGIDDCRVYATLFPLHGD